jgi:hypothetical protein
MPHRSSPHLTSTFHVHPDYSHLNLPIVYLPTTDDRHEASQYAKDAIWHGLVSETACEAEIRKKERTTDLVIQAVKSGFRGVDTACQPKVSLSDFIDQNIFLT